MVASLKWTLLSSRELMEQAYSNIPCFLMPGRKERLLEWVILENITGQRTNEYCIKIKQNQGYVSISDFADKYGISSSIRSVLLIRNLVCKAHAVLNVNFDQPEPTICIKATNYISNRSKINHIWAGCGKSVYHVFQLSMDVATQCYSTI